MTLFLTSAGLKNRKIMDKFVGSINADMSDAKVLFIPTAAINEGGKAMLPVCKGQILEAGIAEKNIKEAEISEISHIPDMNEYCAMYVAGGDTPHLVNEMNKVNFKKTLDDYLRFGGVYLGVSAGSIALSNSFEGCLNYIDCKLNVHKETGSKPGSIDRTEKLELDLTDDQAIIIQDEKAQIFG